MIPLKIGFCIECGCNRPIANAHFSLCLMHNQIRLNAQKSNKGNTANRVVEPVKGPRTPCKPRKPIRKRSEKKILEIRESNEYYDKAITINVERNRGVCRCDECGDIINSPGGSNVSHVVAAGTNKAIYLDMDNHVILCGKFTRNACILKWDEHKDGGRKKMKLWPRIQKIQFTVLHRHYAG